GPQAVGVAGRATDEQGGRFPGGENAGDLRDDVVVDRFATAWRNGIRDLAALTPRDVRGQDEVRVPARRILRRGDGGGGVRADVRRVLHPAGPPVQPFGQRL